MHGERYDYRKITNPGPTANCKLSNLGFMYESDINADMTLAINQLMNLFPLRAAQSGGLSDVKFDVLAEGPFNAYALKDQATFWVLLTEHLLRRSLKIADQISTEYLRQARDANDQVRTDMKRLVFYMLMEFIIQHEFGHIRSGHVCYMGAALGAGVTDLLEIEQQLGQEVGLMPGGTPAMEFMADEAAVGTCVIGSVVGRWSVVPFQTKDVFELRWILDAVAISMICFMLCVPHKKSFTHPSALARFIRLGDIYHVYLSQSEQPQPGVPSMRPGFSAENFQRFRDILLLVKEAAVGNRIHLDQLAVDLMSDMFSQVTHGAARNEIASTIQEVKASLGLWAPHKCQIVAWNT